MGTLLGPVIGLLLVAGEGAPPGPSLFEDPVLAGLVGQALARRPELAAARAAIRAEHEQVAQVGALPDPTLTFGIQNDGFGAIQIGRMQTSFLAVSASQTLPWPGKRGLRADVASLDAGRAEAALRRARLSIRADVERAYVDLLLARDQLALLARLEALWSKSEALARVRYEAGEGAQADVLRAQLEWQRLRQRRFALEADERRALVAVNRLRGEPLAAAVPTPQRLADLPDPPVPDPGRAVAFAESESPELEQARLAGQQAGRGVALARRERWPDVTLTAGIMPRWGDFETMWQASVGLSLPLWAARKQSRALAEYQARGEAARGTVDGVRALLHQRVHERLAAMRALVETNGVYRAGLLVQSEATVTSTLAQYQVGRLGFASVLEALAGYLGDRGGFLDAVAALHRLAIAEREISLESPAGGASSGMGDPAAPDPSVASSAGGAARGPAAAAAMTRM